MLAPANYCFLHQELCLFVCLQPVKMLHSAPLIERNATTILYLKILFFVHLLCFLLLFLPIILYQLLIFR